MITAADFLFIHNCPTVKVGIDDHYGHHTVIHAMEAYHQHKLALCRKADIMKLAFEMMVSEKPLKLSKKGKKELSESWTNGHKEIWTIQAVLAEEALRIRSENNLIFDNASLDWFEWGI